MPEQRDVDLEDAIIEKLSATLEISTRLAIVESNYASKEFVADVKWQLVKWFVGVCLAGIAVGVAIATLVMGFTLQ